MISIDILEKERKNNPYLSILEVLEIIRDREKMEPYQIADFVKKNKTLMVELTQEVTKRHLIKKQNINSTISLDPIFK